MNWGQTGSLILLASVGCIGTPATESVRDGIQIEPSDRLEPTPNKTTPWPAGLRNHRASVQVSQMRTYEMAVTLDTESTNPVPVSPTGQSFKYVYAGPRFAIAPSSDDLQIEISQSVFRDGDQIWNRAKWGIVAYHRPSVSRNAWEMVACPASTPGMIQHRNQDEFSIHDGQVRLSQTSRMVHPAQNTAGVAYALCGIYEETPEFAFMAIPVSIDGDLGPNPGVQAEGLRYDFTVEARCGAPGARGRICPAYPGEDRAEDDTCRAGEDLWIGTTVTALTKQERRDLRSMPGSSIELDNQGLVVTAVYPAYPSASVMVDDGLLAIDGDPLTFHGGEFRASRSFAEQLTRTGPGTHELDVVRAGRFIRFPIEVVPCPALPW